MAVVKVVKYDGTPDVFAWKSPHTELGTWTQIIVNESQEAILFRGGQALDWFGPGRHTLETSNIPILSKLVNLPFGGNSPFTVEVWYINKINTLDVKWGTPTPIQLQDPKHNVFVPIRAYGQFGIKISDSKVFLQTLVGTLKTFTKADITSYFKGAYLTQVKDDISSYLIKKKITALEINAYITEISESLKNKITPTFAEYGIELVNFYVNDISLPENDRGVIKLKEALAKKAEMDIIGYSYTQERSFDTLEGAATNKSSGSAAIMGAGLGLGMGVGLGNNVGGSFSEMGHNININDNKKCPHCNSTITAQNKFCPECGKDTTNKIQDVLCSKCGEKCKSGIKFCPTCGNTLFKACHKCGEVLEEKQKFCPNCGSSTTKECVFCGSKISGELKFCPECGKEVKGECDV